MSDIRVVSADLKSNINIKHRKEAHFFKELVALRLPDDTKMLPRAIVTLRLYETDARLYACLWINGEKMDASGSGWAGGWGYHRASAAAQEAISKAGIELSQSISGVGHSAMIEAVRAIAEFVDGSSKFIIHEAHG